MIVNCVIHGPCGPALVSKDLAKAILELSEPRTIVFVKCDYYGEFTDKYAVTAEFAAHHGLSPEKLYHYGSDEWINELVGICDMCYKSYFAAL